MTSPLPRRRWLQRAAGLTAAGALAPLAATPARAARAPAAGARDLALAHLHTRERLALVYAVDDRFVPDALGTLNHFLRDHYSGEVGEMDPQLYELLHRVRRLLGSEARYEVISGYRAPTTNAHLRATRGGGVAQGSLHTRGRAIDVRLPGVALADLRDAALSLRAGGVGYYPRENFVHIDTGRVRRW
ncbi:MAG: DUF882 domain-containing protein [Rubrivivax sp.]|nr:DUF882 domain-containing protein [Rubrivivax sp.]